MSSPGQYLYEFGPFRLDAVEHLLLCDGAPVPLRPKAFDLLLVLIKRSGHVFGKNELMRELWPDSFVEESNLAVYISALRKALGGGRREHPYIETVQRRGYRFVGGVREVRGEAAGPPKVICAISSKAARKADSKVRSVAVLPFVYLGAVAGEEYLGLGAADALITKLSKLRRRSVRPTCVVRKYDGGRDPLAAGRELRVESVLDGTIQRVGKRIRVRLQLVRVRDGALLWADKFDERFTSILAVEDSISEQVARALTLKLTEGGA